MLVRSSGFRVNVVHVGDAYQTPNVLMEGGCVKCHGAPLHHIVSGELSG